MAETIRVNTSDYELIRARESLLGGFGSIDEKRPRAWLQYGYPQQISFGALYRAYKRSGAGHGAVHKILDRCWQGRPRIKSPDADEVSPWEKKVNTLLDDLMGWQKMRDLDRRNMVGRYAAVVYRVADSRQLPEPLGTGKLVDIVPLWESQIKVLKWNEDEASPDYGKPEMFQIETSPPSQRNDDARPRTWIKVHPSRVQILAEGAVGDNFYDGVPLLEAGFNSLIDLEKIGGGSGESFLKNSARTMTFEFEKDANPQAIAQPNAVTGATETKSLRQVLTEQSRELNTNLDATIALQGGKANTLQTTVSDPTGAFNLAANLFSASVQFPFTLIFGQQTGRLASDEDQKDANARCESRRVNELTPMWRQFIKRMQACGAIDAGDFEIEWPPLGAPGDTEKLDNASKMAAINKTNSEAGQASTFDGNEIRKVAGFEERDELVDIPLEPPEPEPAPMPAPGPGPGPTPQPAPRPVRAANDEDEGLWRRFVALLRRAA